VFFSFFLFLSLRGTCKTYDRCRETDFSQERDIFLVNLDFGTDEKRKRERERERKRVVWIHILLYSLLVSFVLIVETWMSKTDFCLPPRAVSSSPRRNKQGNKIQVLRILPFPACSLRVFFLSFPPPRASSCELFFLFVPFCPLPFKSCSLSSSGRDRLPPARRAIYYPTALPQTQDCLAPFSIS
jgi:hypothetical protein